MVVRNALSTRTTKKKKKVRGPLLKPGKRNPQFHFERLVSVASDETTTYNKEIHTRLNCTPDQDDRTADIPNTSEV